MVFVSFLIVLVIPFNKVLDSSRAWTIFIISFISSFETIKVVVLEPFIFFWIPASVAGTAAVNPNGANFVLPIELLFSLMNLVIYWNNEQPENPRDWIALDIWVFHNVIAVDKLFSIAFRIFLFVSLLTIIHKVNSFH